MKCTLRLTSILILALAVSCERGGRGAAEGIVENTPPALVQCTLLQFASMDPGYPAPWSASFRITNGTRNPIAYTGFPCAPSYVLEILRDGKWENTPGGPSYYPFGPDCGTGMRPCSLPPGESMDVWLAIPGDGESYRMRFGEPAVVTDPISARR